MLGGWGGAVIRFPWLFCVLCGGEGGCNKVSLVFCVLCRGRGGDVIKFPWLFCMLCGAGGRGGGCNKVSLVIVYVYITCVVWGCGGGGVTVPLVMGGGGWWWGKIKAAANNNNNKQTNKNKKTLHKSHDTPAHDGAPHTKFGYKRLSTNAQPTGNKYLSHALQPSPPKTPQ